MKAETLKSLNTDCSPPLQAKLAPWMQALFKKQALIQEWIRAYGSPLHVVVEDEFHRNVADLQSAFKSRGVDGGLFFARKANKLPFFVSAAKKAGIGVDTASITELRETSELGIPAEQIVLTAIGKSEELLREAIAKRCLIVIENDDELALIKQLANSDAGASPQAGASSGSNSSRGACGAQSPRESSNSNRGSSAEKVRIGLRFSGFELSARTVFSRFGIPISHSGTVLESISQCENLSLELLHGHLDRYDTEERAMAARALLEIAKQAKSYGHNVSAIDLGGGLLMRYIEREDQWLKFQEELIAAVKGKRPSFTYMKDGLGFFKAGDNEALYGKADFYPVWNPLSKERFIAAVLDHRWNGCALYNELKSAGIKLFFEPGRALLDNCGVTFANVAFRKRDTEGNLLTGLRMNRMNLRPFRAEFCSDPFLLAPGSRRKAEEGTYLVGCLCSESDTIFRRKLQLDRLAEPGDIFAFANSAGYLCHHMEIGTHGDPLPWNLLLDAENLNVLQKSR